MSCDGCKYWSELIAQATGSGPVEALCLHPNRKQIFMSHGCEDKEPGPSIDDPRNAQHA